MLAAVASRHVSVPTVYVTLVRLEDDGLVSSREQAPAHKLGGRARRIFRVTAAGWEALDQARGAAERLWQGVVRP